MSANEETLFWLVPDTDHAPVFQAIIDALAAPQQAPRFRPHMTLGAVRGSRPDLSATFRGAEPLRLQPLEIGQTDLFTMSLFVRFKRDPALMRARALMESLPGFRAGRAFDPHVSLCYGAPVNRADHDAAIQALLRRPVRFDKLIAMRIPLPVASYDDIRKWQEYASYEIGT